jgi:hydroxyacylglutathione hydrolase
MFLERFYHDGLAQASYLIGCEATGEALVVDANRDIDVYLRAAAAHSLRITHVSETHIHADYVSGSRDLARTTGARLLLSGEGGSDWQYGFAASDGATLLRDGERFDVGRVRVDAIHTPGHTPEHLTLLITDAPVSAEPLGAITGDFIFVGDVGRPDLLERAAGVRGTMEVGARQLYQSLQRFVERFPDRLLLWPGHGAGSACGKALGAVPMSTLGYEKIANWALQARDQNTFVREVLDSQSDPPPYFAVMKQVNRDGPPPAPDTSTPPPHELAERLPRVLRAGALVIDLRPTAAFARGSATGTYNIPLNDSFVGRAGWLVPYDRDVYFITADGEDSVRRATKELSLIGLDRVSGWFDADAVPAADTQTVAQLSPADAAAQVRAGNAVILDVRNADEWKHGHIPGAVHVPLGQLPERAAELQRENRQLVLHCASGGRSGIGASVLLAHGAGNVANMEGGLSAWEQAGLPVTENDA